MGITIDVLVLNGFKQIHEKGILFRDIKPENFMFEVKNDIGSKLYFVDFGASCKYILHSGKHIDQGGGPVGTSLYMSIAAHKGDPSSRRDDLISMMYMLIYISNVPDKSGYYLPWEGSDSDDKVLQWKEKIDSTSLCSNIADSNLRALLKNLFNSVASLKPTEKPAYSDYVSMLENQLNNVTIKNKSTSIRKQNSTQKKRRNRNRSAPTKEEQPMPSEPVSQEPSPKLEQSNEVSHPFYII